MKTPAERTPEPETTPVEKRGEWMSCMTRCPGCGGPMTLKWHESCPPEWADSLAKLVVCNRCADILSAWWGMEAVVQWVYDVRNEPPSPGRLHAVRKRVERFLRHIPCRTTAEECAELFAHSSDAAAKMVQGLRQECLRAEDAIQRRRYGDDWRRR